MLRHFNHTYEHIFDEIMVERGYYRNDNRHVPETIVYQNEDDHIIRINSASGFIYSHYKGFSLSVCCSSIKYSNWMIPGNRRQPCWPKGTPFVSSTSDPDELSILSVFTNNELIRLRRRDNRRRVRTQLRKLFMDKDYDSMKTLRRKTGIGLTLNNCYFPINTDKGVKYKSYHEEILNRKLYQQGQLQNFLRYCPLTLESARKLTLKNIPWYYVYADSEILNIFLERFPDIYTSFKHWLEQDDNKMLQDWSKLTAILKLNDRKVKLKQIKGD